MDDPDDGFEKRLSECRLAVRACVCGLVLAWGAYLNSQGGGSDAGSPELGRNPRWPRDPFRSDRFLFCLCALASASVVDGVPSCPTLVLRRDAGPYVGRTRLQHILDDPGLDLQDEDWCGEERRWPGSPSDFGTGYSPWDHKDPFAGGDRFLLGMCRSDKERSRPPGDRDRSLSLPCRSLVAPFRSLSLPFAPTNPAGSLPIAPFRSHEPVVRL